MSRNLDCDPARGFVAFPVDLFDLDLSPGAFRTLAELCRMANRDGQCWPSLAQLGRRLGRSRAAVSGYIAELRAADVLSTQEQRMANGYNYRLRYTVTFWKDWRGRLASGAQKPERTVQPDERPLRTQNHIHKNHESGVSDDLRKSVSAWRVCVGKAPYPAFESWPTEPLITEAERALSEPADVPPPLISADISQALSAFLTEKNVQSNDVALPSSRLSTVLATQHDLDVFLLALRRSWQPHWKKAPTEKQLLRLARQLPAYTGPQTQRKLLHSYLRRWKLYSATLLSDRARGTVAA